MWNSQTQTSPERYLALSMLAFARCPSPFLYPHIHVRALLVSLLFVCRFFRPKSMGCQGTEPDQSRRTSLEFRERTNPRSLGASLRQDQVGQHCNTITRFACGPGEGWLSCCVFRYVLKLCVKTVEFFHTNQLRRLVAKMTQTRQDSGWCFKVERAECWCVHVGTSRCLPAGTGSVSFLFNSQCTVRGAR